MGGGGRRKQRGRGRRGLHGTKIGGVVIQSQVGSENFFSAVLLVLLAIISLKDQSWENARQGRRRGRGARAAF